MGSNLLEKLGYDESDPEIQAERQDAADHADLIESLVHTRRRCGLTQTDVAERMGTTQSAVSNFERIGGNPTLSTIQRYARAVGARVRSTCVVEGEADTSTTTSFNPYPSQEVADANAGN